MARIIGTIEARDDYTHPLGPEPNFNESMYFNFFDPNRKVGGFVRLGNRANEGYAEATVTVFLPDGRVLFNFARPRIESNDAFDAGGLCFEVVEPSDRLRTSYVGSAVELADPTEMANPRKAFTDNPQRHVTIDLLHTAVGPMYGSARDESEASESHERQFAKAHYEQHMHVTGSIDVAGTGFEIDGYGLRDHSWGPRYWQAISSYEWLTMNFGADFGAMVSIVRRDDGEKAGGVIVRGDDIDFIERATIEPEYEANGIYHRALRVGVETRAGKKLEITGTVRSFIPLRNRRAGMTTHVGEGMTEWQCEGRTGYGLSELLRQV